MLGVTGTALAFQGDGEREAMPDGSQARGMMTGDCEDAIERGLELPGANRQAARRLVGDRRLPRQRGRHQPGEPSP